MLLANCETLLSSTYDDRPSKLFDGMHHARIAVVLGAKGPPAHEAHEGLLYVTPYNKWYKEERNHLFHRLRYIKAPREVTPDYFPKVGSRTEITLLRTLMSCKAALGSLISSSESKWKVFYKITGVGHWFTVTLRPPKFFRNGAPSSSTREATICFRNKADRDTAFAILNSSLFYWFYQVRTNCRDFNPSDYRTFPIPDLQDADAFSALAEGMQSALDSSTRLVEIDHARTGKVRFEQFRPRQAKPVVDHIDGHLAKRYRFTAEELDFIINYDAKYRMGEGSGEEGEPEDTPAASS
jgi:hypothetical protein